MFKVESSDSLKKEFVGDAYMLITNKNKYKQMVINFEDNLFKGTFYELRIGVIIPLKVLYKSKNEIDKLLEDIYKSSSIDDLSRKYSNIFQYSYELEPGELAIVITLEKLRVQNDVCGFLTIKHFLAIKGMNILYGTRVDPNFEGNLIFIVYNVGGAKISLERYRPIVSISFFKLESIIQRFPGKTFISWKNGLDQIIREFIKEERIMLFWDQIVELNNTIEKIRVKQEENNEKIQHIEENLRDLKDMYVVLSERINDLVNILLATLLTIFSGFFAVILTPTKYPESFVDVIILIVTISLAIVLTVSVIAIILKVFDKSCKS